MEKFFQDNATNGHDITIFGIPICELTKEKLMASINFLGKELDLERNRSKSILSMFNRTPQP